MCFSVLRCVAVCVAVCFSWRLECDFSILGRRAPLQNAEPFSRYSTTLLWNTGLFFKQYYKSTTRTSKEWGRLPKKSPALSHQWGRLPNTGLVFRQHCNSTATVPFVHRGNRVVFREKSPALSDRWGRLATKESWGECRVRE